MSHGQIFFMWAKGISFVLKRETFKWDGIFLCPMGFPFDKPKWEF